MHLIGESSAQLICKNLYSHQSPSGHSNEKDCLLFFLLFTYGVVRKKGKIKLLAYIEKSLQCIVVVVVVVGSRSFCVGFEVVVQSSCSTHLSKSIKQFNP